MKKSTKKAIKGLKKMYKEGLLPEWCTPIHTSFPLAVKKYKKLYLKKKCKNLTGQ
jgi:hypothetical protein